MTTMSVPPLLIHAAAVADLPRPLRYIHDVARDDGIAAGLRALAEQWAPAGVPFGPAGHAILPTDLAPAGPAQRLRTITIGADTVLAVKADHSFRRAPTAWLIGVSWLRLGASRWLLKHATDHVSGRTVGTESLLQQQMVKGMIAEALTEQLEAEALLDGRTDPAVLIEANARIQAADRMLLRLLGASGFAAGPPSHTCWVSELLADAYIGYDPLDGGVS
jgi:hypothetical protein